MAEIVKENGEIVDAEVVPTTAVVPVHHNVQLGMLRADKPSDFVVQAADLATALADIISRRKLFSTIQGKDFVKVEGWTTLAAMLGVTPHEVSVAEMPEGCFTATVELRRLADGAVVGRASAECGSSDDAIWAKRPRNARRSMALTRATGKACRLAFSWIMTLAGYEVTPAEEMDGVDDRRKPADQPKAQTSGPAVDVQQLKIIRTLCATLKNAGDEHVKENMTRWLGVQSAEEIPASRFEEVQTELQRQIQRRMAGAKA